jgi:hypothetical protein
LTLEGEKTFSAGASYYGVSDLEALARDTHKFESRYLDWPIRPYPQDQKIYAERSPITHVDRLFGAGDLLPGRGGPGRPSQSALTRDSVE